jgi:hypothetical protein
VPSEGPGEESVREVDGMRVVSAPDIAAALRVLDLAKGDVTPLIRPRPGAPQRPALGLV